MNIEQANSIPMSEILAKLDVLPVRNNALDIWYYSPFRKERIANLHVNAVKNIWHDLGEGRGGNAVDFVCAWLEHTREDHTPADALRWLDNMMLKPSPLISFPQQSEDEKEIPLLLKKISTVQQQDLISYLDTRGIPQSLARRYLKELLVTDARTGKDFYSLGMRNEENGYTLRNKGFKGTIGNKHISFVRGLKTSCEEINIFETWTDFLSALVYQKGNRFEGDTIILNSLSCVSKAMPYIEVCPYDKLRTWLDNDAAGEKVTQVFNRFVLARGDMEFVPMNKLYKPHKDVSAWHMNNLKL